MVALASADISEPYIWTPANSVQVTAFYNALTTRASATLTLDDGAAPPPPPAIRKLRLGDANPSGIAIGDKKASGIAIGDTIIWTAGGTPAPAGPHHTFQINVGNGGLNVPLSRGSVTTGSGTYSTPGGKSVTVQHCRLVGSELNFALQGSPNPVAADFPSRIVATKLTGGEVERTLTPQAGSLRSISNGRFVRQDYDPTSGNVADVFVNGQTVRVDLYYE